MRKLKLVLLLLLPIWASAQTIQNGNFETWNTTTYDVAPSWYNSNV